MTFPDPTRLILDLLPESTRGLWDDTTHAGLTLDGLIVLADEQQTPFPGMAVFLALLALPGVSPHLARMTIIEVAREGGWLSGRFAAWNKGVAS